MHKGEKSDELIFEEYQVNRIELANCKKIVELQKGEIWNESKIESVATFYFTMQNLRV